MTSASIRLPLAIIFSLAVLSAPVFTLGQSTDDTTAASQIYCPHLSTTFKKGYRDSNTNGQDIVRPWRHTLKRVRIIR